MPLTAGKRQDQDGNCIWTLSKIWRLSIFDGN